MDLMGFVFPPNSALLHLSVCRSRFLDLLRSNNSPELMREEIYGSQLVVRDRYSLVLGMGSS